MLRMYRPSNSTLNASVMTALNTSVNSNLGASVNSALEASVSSTVSSTQCVTKPALSNRRIARGGAGSMRLLQSRSTNLDASLSLRSPTKARRGVKICEEANDIFEVSTRSVRVERGDLDLFYPEDFEPDPIIECFMCRYEAETDQEAGMFRIYNLPDGGWQMLCPKCDPPDATWEFDRTVAVVDSLVPADLMQLVFLFLNTHDTHVCAQVCRQWNELSWTVLTLQDNGKFLQKLYDSDKMRNVWVLRVFLHTSKDPAARIKELSENLCRIEALSELTITGVSGSESIKALAQALRGQRFLQVLDLGACTFQVDGLRAILSAMEENKYGAVELVLPRCCMDSGDRKYTAQAAAQALQSLLAGTYISAMLV